MRVAGPNVLKHVSVKVRVPERPVDPDVLPPLHRGPLGNLHHEGRLHVAQSASFLPTLLHVLRPLRHHHFEGIRVNVHDILEREEAVLGHPVHAVALADAHGAAGEHEPGRRLLGRAHNRTLDHLVLPTLPLQGVVVVVRVINAPPEALELLGELPVVHLVVLAGGLREIVLLWHLEAVCKTLLQLAHQQPQRDRSWALLHGSRKLLPPHLATLIRGHACVYASNLVTTQILESEIVCQTCQVVHREEVILQGIVLGGRRQVAHGEAAAPGSPGPSEEGRL
mmetsp:Transcript_53499/g.152643  ORF Transcript_53499/g.152643 Transcript_53499/m.152643 type:complete len:281 (-) Transcript_53499:419-1261(-)